MVELPRYVEDSIVRTASELALNRLESEYQFVLREHYPSPMRLWGGLLGSFIMLGIFAVLAFVFFKASGGLGGPVVYREGMLLAGGMVVFGAVIALSILIGSWAGYNGRRRDVDEELGRISSEMDKHRRIVDRRIYFS